MSLELPSEQPRTASVGANENDENYGGCFKPFVCGYDEVAVKCVVCCVAGYP